MSDVDGLNTGYARALLEQWLESPEEVPAEWRSLFESGRSELVADHPALAQLLAHAVNGDVAPPLPSAPPAVATQDDVLLGGVAAAMALVKAHRMHGHLAARLDPLGSEPVGDPALEAERLEPPLTPELQARIPARVLRVHVPGATLAEVLPRLREIYCGTVAYEIEHISDHEQRVWLRQAIESGRYRKPLAPEEQRTLLARLSRVEGFERYLRRAFLGQKQFSIEGLDVLVPMLDESIEHAARAGASEVVIGMAHRGRLNVLAHTVGRPYEEILREFEGERTIEAVTSDPEGGTGDVKYHLGAEGKRTTSAGEISIILAANPSHLEAVDPVVEGLARAAQTDRTSATCRHDADIAMPLLIHGDASFPGQGVVPETLNLAGLYGYSTGGTLHVIANNQVGFTTDPSESRSTRYSSDLAKGFDIPIIHVNADDAEASIAAVRLALAFRSRFHTDVVIDLVGYRRHGHNEQDEPAYTQPLLAARIAGQATVRDRYAATLAAAGVVSEEEAAGLVRTTELELRAAHEALKATFGRRAPQALQGERSPGGAGGGPTVTAVAGETLQGLNGQLLRVPERFHVNEKLARSLARRVDALDASEPAIDWGQAESLAYASLIVEGVPIRLTGQDTERGTFSHRHLVLHDVDTGESWTPIRHLDGARASFEVHNSPLSEAAALGFEYGYSVASEGLVLWESQFGDFVNGGQVIVDQFIVSGLAKWGQTSRLTLLLPHGYEGSGPEHSRARLERFLQLAAQENLRIANPTTAAQLFHLVRRQALQARGRPLVVMTPKSLLRFKQAASRLEDLTRGGFAPVLGDPASDLSEARRLLLCSGKIYYDIVGHEDYTEGATVAVARLEQLYPFPAEAMKELIGSFERLEEVVWTQEEPQNMGAWRATRHRLEEAIGGRVPLRYVGRPWRASPSEGYPTAHLREQDRIIRTALAPLAGSSNAIQPVRSAAR